MRELKSPKRKIRPCFSCGRDCTGKRCYNCYNKIRKEIWTPEKRREQSQKLRGYWHKGMVNEVDESLLTDFTTRFQYFLQKYGGVGNGIK